MALTAEERAFVRRRARFARAWPLVGSALLSLVVGLAGWLLWTRPLLINPWAVISGLVSDSIPESTLALMAAMLPVVMLACLGVLAAALVLAFSAFSNERKHIAIIRRIEGEPADDDR